MSSLPKIIGGGFNLAGMVAPVWAGKRLAALFLTPIPRMGASEWPTELLAQSTETTINVGGRALPTWKFGDSSRKAVFCHGWGGCGANSQTMVTELLEAGFEVHAFDGPSHGDDRRVPTNLLEFAESIAELDQLHGPFTAAIGHSFGGGAVVLALGRGFDPAHAVLIAPMIDSYAATDYFSDQLGLSDRLRSRLATALQERFREYPEAEKAWDLADWAKTHTTPARIFHDPADPRVPYAAAVRAADNWENCTITAVADVGHQEILKDPAVLNELVDFVSVISPPT